MSSLRKQEIRRKSKKRGLSSDSSRKNTWTKFLFRMLRLPFNGTLWLVGIFRKFPRTSIVSCGIITGLVTIAWGVRSIHSAIESRLPQSISVQCEDDSLLQRVNKTAWQALQDAKIRGTSRTEFLTQLATKLNTIESLDNFQIRSGLDRKLQIWAIPQNPAFVLEGTEGQRAVISTRMQAIATLSSGTPAPDLPYVHAPEIKITQRSILSKEKRARIPSISGINLPWIYRQIHAMNNSKEALVAQNFVVNSYFWKQSTGFSVKLDHKKLSTIATNSVSINSTSTPNSGASSAVPTTTIATTTTPSDSMTVIFGEADIGTKKERMLAVISNFSAKNIVPELVDLSFPDRALVRMGLSDNGTTISF